MKKLSIIFNKLVVFSLNNKQNIEGKPSRLIGIVNIFYPLIFYTILNDSNNNI